MIGGFAFCDSTIVATGATSHHRPVINSSNRRPASICMAALARCRTRNMAGLFSRCQRAVVTAVALFWRAAELRPPVTTIATDLAVGTRQRKTGRVMVHFVVRLRQDRIHEYSAQQQQKRRISNSSFYCCALSHDQRVMPRGPERNASRSMSWKERPLWHLAQSPPKRPLWTSSLW